MNDYKGFLALARLDSALHPSQLDFQNNRLTTADFRLLTGPESGTLLAPEGPQHD